MLDELAEVYKNDAATRTMTAKERLAYHQEKSLPVMAELKEWMEQQLATHTVEENDACGRAIKYFLDHYEGLIQFCRVAATPIDNNLAERILKRAVLNRKNSLFFKTERGAAVADVNLSLIQSSALAQVDVFDYLVTLLRNAPSRAFTMVALELPFAKSKTSRLKHYGRGNPRQSSGSCQRANPGKAGSAIVVRPIESMADQFLWATSVAVRVKNGANTADSIIDQDPHRGAPSIAKHKGRAAVRVLQKFFTTQSRESINTKAEVHWLDSYKDSHLGHNREHVNLAGSQRAEPQ